MIYSVHLGKHERLTYCAIVALVMLGGVCSALAMWVFPLRVVRTCAGYDCTTTQLPNLVHTPLLSVSIAALVFAVGLKIHLWVRAWRRYRARIDAEAPQVF